MKTGIPLSSYKGDYEYLYEEGQTKPDLSSIGGIHLELYFHIKLRNKCN